MGVIDLLSSLVSGWVLTLLLCSFGIALVSTDIVLLKHKVKQLSIAYLVHDILSMDRPTVTSPWVAAVEVHRSPCETSLTFRETSTICAFPSPEVW